MAVPENQHVGIGETIVGPLLATAPPAGLVHDRDADPVEGYPSYLGQAAAQLVAVVVAIHADQPRSSALQRVQQGQRNQSPAWTTTSASSTAPHTSAGRSGALAGTCVSEMTSKRTGPLCRVLNPRQDDVGTSPDRRVP